MWDVVARTGTHVVVVSSGGKWELAYSRNIARVSASSVTFSARSSTFESAALCQHERRRHKYAPRPFFLPVGSTSTRPSGVRTSRTYVRFASCSRHATHIRCGTCFGRGPRFVFGVSDADPALIVAPWVIRYPLRRHRRAAIPGRSRSRSARADRGHRRR